MPNRETTLRWIISVFVILHFSVTMAWLLPHTPLRQAIIDSCKFTWAFAGFDQRWELFAPDIRVLNCHVVMLITYKNGETAMWPLPRMDLLDPVSKYTRDKFRKWGVDNLPWEDHREFWPDLARYTGRLHYDPNNPPVTAIMAVFYSKLEDPQTKFLMSSARTPHDSWRTAFCYRFKPEDFR